MTSDAVASACGGTGQASIQVVVIGDAGAGKSTLIEAIATESFAAEVPHLLPSSVSLPTPIAIAAPSLSSILHPGIQAQICDFFSSSWYVLLAFDAYPFQAREQGKSGRRMQGR